MKQFWTCIKHKRSDGNTIPPLKSVGLLDDDSVDKANILSAQFQQAFSCKEELDKSQFKTRCNMRQHLTLTSQKE
jgi:hypothetical protein